MAGKYILHGGFAAHINEQNDKFFREILKDAPDTPRILLVYFAKELDRIPVNKEEDQAQFGRNSGSKKLSFEVAEESSFEKQVSRSDVIYLHGGTTLKLLEALKKFHNLKELFEGKIIAGESAGAYVLSTYFHSKTADGAFKGLGFVPVKLICHYEGVNEDKLKEGPKKLDTLLLRDYEYRVFV